MTKTKRSKFDQEVADLVTKIRKEKGVSQTQIASYIHATRSFVSQIEASDSDIKYNVNHLNLIAYYLGCSPRDLMPNEAIHEEPRKPAKKYPKAKRTYKRKKS